MIRRPPRSTLCPDARRGGAGRGCRGGERESRGTGGRTRRRGEGGASARGQPGGREGHGLRGAGDEGGSDGVGGRSPLDDRLVPAISEGEVKGRWGGRHCQGKAGGTGQS